MPISHAHTQAHTQAIHDLQNGECVALPTETVYGLAALASNSIAVERIYALKNRPTDHPLSICVFTPEQAGEVCRISPLAQHLIDAFWPGPLTLVLPQKTEANIAKNVNTGLQTLGIRCPNVPWRTAFSKLGFNSPLALTSANITGQPSPLTAQDVANSLGENAPFILEEPINSSGIDSTIIAIENENAKLLRVGALGADAFAPFAINWIDA